VADGRRAVLLGVTEQLVGQRAFGVSGYRYCGNLLGPRLPRDEVLAMVREARALVNHLAAAFELRGLNGVDFVWREGRCWTIEVNPRPSASLELMDSAYNVRVFEAHVRSFAGELPNFDLEKALTTAPAMGKAILFTTQDVLAPNTDGWFERGIRDVPHSGEPIGKGHPVCTMLVSSTSPAACLRALRDKAAKVRWVMLPAP
jgi:predicted ATP-grasp superfamily ATP-dependent carboligase